MNELSRVEAEAAEAIAQAATLKSLEEIDTEYLGRKAGKLTGLLRSIGSLPPDQKPLFGQALNEAKGRVESALTARRQMLAAHEQSARELAEMIDVTLRGAHRLWDVCTR